MSEPPSLLPISIPSILLPEVIKDGPIIELPPVEEEFHRSQRSLSQNLIGKAKIDSRKYSGAQDP